MTKYAVASQGPETQEDPNKIRGNKCWLIVIAAAIIVLIIIAIIIGGVLIWYYTTQYQAPGEFLRMSPTEEFINFQQGDPTSYNRYMNSMTSFLEAYENNNQVGENFVDCSHGGRSELDTACRIDIDSLGPSCTANKDYGYDEGQPCVILAIKGSVGWKPSSSYVNVTCEADGSPKENLGRIKYYPRDGIPSSYFPLVEDANAPLVAVQFQNPANGIVNFVKCKVTDTSAKGNPSFERTFQFLVD